jgi:hypothetical protein
MMVNLYKTFASPLSDDTLFGWHRMLMTGRQNLTDIGRYRTSSEPMQVLSGAMGSPKIHFEAPAIGEGSIGDQAIHYVVQSNCSRGSGAVTGADEGRGCSPVL